MKKKVLMWTLTMGASLYCLGCDGGLLLDATAVQLETSLISLFDGLVTLLVYNAFNLPTTTNF